LTVNDPSSLSFALTYVGTLGVAALMLFSQLIALTALLVLAGAVSLFTLVGLTIVRLSRGSRFVKRQ
jgi:hypothetical protein